MKPTSGTGRASSETGVPPRGRRGGDGRGGSEACEGLFAGETAKVAIERFHVGGAGGNDADIDFGYSP